MSLTNPRPFPRVLPSIYGDLGHIRALYRPICSWVISAGSDVIAASHEATATLRVRTLTDIVSARGGVAQLGERVVRNDEVGSSILLLSTMNFFLQRTTRYVGALFCF